MKGAILEDGDYCFTTLDEVFKGIENIQKQYNWLITDIECYPEKQSNIELFSKEYCWLSGDELSEIIRGDNFQWIWGVFSGFSKSISKDDVLQFKLPYADGNKELWKDKLSIQHPLAEIEIIAWDSSKTLIISKNDNIINSFINYFYFSFE
ncbi:MULTISPECIES: DUF2691 family protein [Terrisporobacter]|uniref:DUF2691 family protein n=1 Tax=Terrisporobacter TaxID=1505652 RepID=UPI001A90B3CF|nr:MULTISPECIES: DUF2691 family protein [Terrisporobacter]MBN9648080.1 DUF2691 family protein [Terrisporobacter glycolicus]